MWVIGFISLLILSPPDPPSTPTKDDQMEGRWRMDRKLGLDGGFPKLEGGTFLGAQKKDYRILVSILGSPYFGKLCRPLLSKPPPLSGNYS